MKYYHFWKFVTNGDVKIKHVNTKEQIVDIFNKPLESEFLGYLHYKLNGLQVKGILICKGVEVGILVVLS